MPIALMLATLTDRRDFGDDWLLERKFDGERCVARKDGGEVRLESRTGKDLTGTYPEVRAARGRPAGSRAAARRRGGRLRRRPDVVQPAAAAPRGRPTLPQTTWPPIPVVFCVFDLLEIDGEDLTGQPLLERRARLAEARSGRARRCS